MNADQIKALVREHLDAEAAHDPQKAASFYKPDGEYFLAPLGLYFRGRDAVAAQYGNSYVSFPDLEATIDGDSAAAGSYIHWGRLKGKLSGGFAGFPATGKAVDVGYVSIYDIEDGQIARETVHFDLVEFCSQLGLDIDAVRGVARSMSVAMAGAAA